MITFEEFLHGHEAKNIPQDIQDNMFKLLKKVNVLGARWGSPMIVTSGYRTLADQMRINPKATRSNHMTGHAIDISDPDLAITAWLKSPEGMKILEELGLYCEDGNKNWLHCQDVAPKSGHRWFYP